jgi:hypothetical protein
MRNRRSAAALLLCASLLTPLAGPRLGAAGSVAAASVPPARVVIPEPPRVKPSPPPASALHPTVLKGVRAHGVYVPGPPMLRPLDFVKPREHLAYFEIYHTTDEGEYYHEAISLDRLLSMNPIDDYVRVRKENSHAVGDLYRALRSAAFDRRANCAAQIFDARWAIALHYEDGTKDVIGFGPLSNCIRVLKRKGLIAVSPALLRYVKRNFPFMH